MERPPLLNEIREALFRLVIETLGDDDNVFLAAPCQDADPELEKLIVSCSFTPGLVDREELGGYGALAKRDGIWRMTISALPRTDARMAWDLADKLEAAFMPYTVDGLSVTGLDDDGVMPVYCDFPYAEDVGMLPDNRHGITVTVPWWTRTQN